MTTTTIIAFIVLNVGKRFIKEKVEISENDDVLVGH